MPINYERVYSVNMKLGELDRPGALAEALGETCGPTRRRLISAIEQAGIRLPDGFETERYLEFYKSGLGQTSKREEIYLGANKSTRKLIDELFGKSRV